MKKENTTLFADFINKAQQKLERSKKYCTKELCVPSLMQDGDEDSGKIKIRSLSAAELSECVNMPEDPNDMNTGDVYAVYIGVVEPDLRAAAKELKNLGQIDRPLDIVYTFDFHEIGEIAAEIMKLSGVVSDKKVKVVENLKN